MRKNINYKVRVFEIGILFLAAFAALFIMCANVLFANTATVEDQNIELKLKINEVKNLLQEEKQEAAIQGCDDLRGLVDTIERPDVHQNVNLLIILAFMIFSLCMGGLLFYIYCSILSPFGKLKDFAENISRGDLDIPLIENRSQYFGQFTWAFDHMRAELKKSKAGELEAIENNKTVIAALSHDIKTPIAGMRAVAEALEAGMDTTPEKRQKYIDMLINRCDEVTRLTNDLFIHSISEMDKLKITSEEVDLSELIQKQTSEWNESGRGEIRLQLQENVSAFCDRIRTKQIIENILNNAEKYAKGSPIDVILTQKDDDIFLQIRDYGPGIPDEDMPFIKNKFYRGKNVGEVSGSGLGLFIVTYLVEKMGGSFSVQNVNPGLMATIHLRKR